MDEFVWVLNSAPITLFSTIEVHNFSCFVSLSVSRLEEKSFGGELGRSGLGIKTCGRNLSLGQGRGF